MPAVGHGGKLGVCILDRRKIDLLEWNGPEFAAGGVDLDDEVINV